MSVSVTIDQFWKGNEIKIQGKEVINKSIYETGLIIEGQAKLLCPIDTGRLAGSITTQSKEKGTEIESPAIASDKITAPNNDDEVYVGTAVEYGIWQEFGTVKMNAQPFLRPALDLAKGQVLTIVKKNSKYIFKDYIKE